MAARAKSLGVELGKVLSGAGRPRLGQRWRTRGEEARGRANESSYLADLIESAQNVGFDEESETPN